MQRFIVKITQENAKLLSDHDIGCFIVTSELSKRFLEKFVTAAHEQKKLVLAAGEDAVDLYKQYQTDGLIVNTIKEIKPQKIVKEMQKLAPKAILGVICRNRRHEAMLVSECEPDFVIFKFWEDGYAGNKELLEWYNDLFLLQNAVQIEEDIDFKTLPADFVILDDIKYQTLV